MCEGAKYAKVRELKQGQAGPASPCHVSALHISVGTENGWKEPKRTGAVPWPEDLEVLDCLYG